MEGQSHEWFVGRLKDAEADDEEQLDAPDGGGGAMLALQDVASIVAPRIDIRFVRCHVRVGDDTQPWHKVWFDNYSGGGGNQRGFLSCPFACGCIKYKPTFGSRLQFATAMWLWLEHGRTEPALSRAAHLEYWPSDVEIADAEQHATLKEF